MEKKESPLEVFVLDGQLVIRVGVNRLDGNEYHPTIPSLKFEDRDTWVNDVMYEIQREEQDGSTPLTDLLDNAMVRALENGSIGVAEYSPTHFELCAECDDELAVPVCHTKWGQLCQRCLKSHQDPTKGDQ